MKVKECFNEPTEFNFLEVTPNDIEKEIKNLRRLKMLRFKNITANLSKKRQIYVIRYYKIFGPNKLYEKGSKGS